MVRPGGGSGDGEEKMGLKGEFELGIHRLMWPQEEQGFK